jgi:hypothetical protein
LFALGTSYVAWARMAGYLAALPLLAMFAYYLFFSDDDADVASAFGCESILPRFRDPDLADIDHFDAGPDLLICQGRKPLVDERSDPAYCGPPWRVWHHDGPDRTHGEGPRNALGCGQSYKNVKAEELRALP